MDWQQISNERQESDDYAIQRVANYYYELVHAGDGVIRKYRTPEGARRAALRHKNGSHPHGERRTPSGRLRAALDFQAPQLVLEEENKDDDKADGMDRE